MVREYVCGCATLFSVCAGGRVPGCAAAVQEARAHDGHVVQGGGQAGRISLQQNLTQLPLRLGSARAVVCPVLLLLLEQGLEFTHALSGFACTLLDWRCSLGCR